MLKDEAYRYLSDMVFKGFMTMRTVIGGKSFIFKSINDREFDLIKLYSGPESHPEHYSKFNINYTIFSIFMIETENVIQDRDLHYKSLYGFFSEMPSIQFKKILDELTELKRHISEVATFVEGFNYTEFARKKWVFYGKDLPTKVEFTGIPGTDKIGLNTFQEYWIYINKALDEEEKHNRYFDLALMVASATNSKGTKKVGAKHDSNIQALKKKRYNIARDGRVDKTIKWKPEGWAAPVDTAEQLVAELDRQMHGVKDKHDYFIDAYVDKLQKDSDDVVREQERLLKESHERHKGMPMLMGEQRVMTPIEVEDMMKRRNPNNLVIVRSDDIASDKDHDRYYRKIGNKVLTAKE